MFYRYIDSVLLLYTVNKNILIYSFFKLIYRLYWTYTEFYFHPDRVVAYGFVILICSHVANVIYQQFSQFSISYNPRQPVLQKVFWSISRFFFILICIYICLGINLNFNEGIRESIYSFFHSSWYISVNSDSSFPMFLEITHKHMLIY